MNLDAQLQEAILEILPEVELVLGWGEAPEFDELADMTDPSAQAQSVPLFMKSPEDVRGFKAGPLAVQNLVTFLPEYKGRKVGIVVKGCDSRSIIQLLSEKNFLKREEIVIIGFPCEGVLDKSGATAGKCKSCRYPNALVHDVFVGEERPGLEDNYAELQKFEALSLAERLSFWEKEMERCIRCYACRNACPLCRCKDHCVAGSRDPHWLSQADSPRDKLFFQLIHATHLAGRCTGCGECARACPMGIPVGLFKRFMNRASERLFGFQGGLDPEARSPLQTFLREEPRIIERDWK